MSRAPAQPVSATPAPAAPAAKTEPSRYNAPALDKGLDILETLSRSPDGLTLKQLAGALDRNVNQIFRMVMVLLRRHYIQVDEHDRYTLTLRMFTLAHHQPPIKHLIDKALPLLHELAGRTQQSCHLAVYEQGHCVVIAQVDSPGRWSLGLKLGSLMGLADTSSGHILLAYQDEAGRARMLRDHVRVEGELDLDPGQLLALLAKVRETGCSLMPSKQIRGVTNIAFPVHGLKHHGVAAINVPYIARIDGAHTPTIDDVQHILKDICQRLSHQLGADHVL